MPKSSPSRMLRRLEQSAGVLRRRPSSGTAVLSARPGPPAGDAVRLASQLAELVIAFSGAQGPGPKGKGTADSQTQARGQLQSVVEELQSNGLVVNGATSEDLDGTRTAPLPDGLTIEPSLLRALKNRLGEALSVVEILQNGTVDDSDSASGGAAEKAQPPKSGEANPSPGPDRADITSFRGEYNFLSNFYPSPISIDGITYPTVEHAFQAFKTHSREEKLALAGVKTPGGAKQKGRKVKLRADWEQVKVGLMYECLGTKFRHGSDLCAQLVATGSANIIEGNRWHDNFWGSCVCVKHAAAASPAKNHLGVLLMRIREERRS